MVTVTLDEITLNAVKAALDLRIVSLTHQLKAVEQFGLPESEDTQRAIVWMTDALLQSKLAREYLGDPEVLVDHPVHATYEVDPEFNPGYVMGPGDEVPRFDPDWNREGQPEFNGAFNKW